jgi:hypothetical protein
MNCEYCQEQIEQKRVDLGLDICFDCASQSVTKKCLNKINLEKMSKLKGVTFEEDDAKAIDATKVN